MKVTQAPKQFTPVVITLETPEEVDALLININRALSDASHSHTDAYKFGMVLRNELRDTV